MPRHARFFVPGTLLHVVSRFVDRDWYLTSDDERSYYLHLLGRAMRRTDWLCVAYCLMSNHLHFAMVAGAQSLESWAKRVNSPFANWLNKRRNRLGPIFADRPLSLEVPSWRALDVIAYIHNNPVRARVVDEAAASSWSSHRAYVGLDPTPPWLHVGEGLARCGYNSRRSEFDAVVRMLQNRRVAYPEIDAEAPVDSADRTTTLPLRSPSKVVPFDILARVANAFTISVEALQQRHARGVISEAKQAAVLVARRLGTSLSDVASALGVSRQRASRLASAVGTEAQQRLVAMIVDELRKQPTRPLLSSEQGCQS